MLKLNAKKIIIISVCVLFKLFLLIFEVKTGNQGRAEIVQIYLPGDDLQETQYQVPFAFKIRENFYVIPDESESEYNIIFPPPTSIPYPESEY